MSTKEDVVKWLNAMGYDGDIPETLDNICNASTFFIWKQIIQNARNKRNVERIRNNIIINRLNNKPLTHQDEYTFKMSEIDVYNKRNHMHKKVALMSANVEEKRHKIDNMGRNNKIKYITIEHLKSKINENEQKIYLLNSKCKMLKVDIHNAKEALSLVKSITPSEMDDNYKGEEITQTLKKCAEKLENYVSQMPLSQKVISQPSILTPMFQKTNNNTTFEQYLSQSKIQLTVNKMSNIKRADKENIRTVNKVLTFDEAEHVEKTKIPLILLNNNALDKTVIENSINKVNTRARSNRESLGILPDFCLDEVFQDVTMANSKHNSSENIFSEENKIVQVSTAHITRLITNNSKLISKIKSKTDFNNAQEKGAFSFKDICNNISFIETIQEVLHNYDRRLIWNIFLNINENVITDLQKSILNCGNHERNTKNNKVDIAKLYFIHIQIALQTDKLKKSNQTLFKLIKKEREQLFGHLNSRRISENRIDEVNRILDLEIENVGLDATIACMKKEIGTAKKTEYNSEMQLIKKKSNSTKEQIAGKLSGIQDFIGQIYKILINIKTTKEEISSSVHRLNHFVLDMSWAQSLCMKLFSQEMKMFESFPLNYNRKFKYTDTSTYFRDISFDNVPSHIDLDSDTIYMMANILDSPYSPPETILLSILKAKLKLQALKSLNTKLHVKKYSKYTLSDLEAQESYIVNALNKLNGLIHSSASTKVLSTSSTMKRIVEIWIEMPLKGFISPNRLVNGKDYKHFEQKYINYCNN